MVFAFFEDPERFPMLSSDIAVEVDPPGDLRVGTRVRQRLLRRATEVTSEITAYDPPRRLTVVARGENDSEVVSDYLFDDVPGGTRVDFRLEQHTPGLRGIVLTMLTPLAVRRSHAIWMRAIEVVERSPDDDSTKRSPGDHS